MCPVSRPFTNHDKQPLTAPPAGMGMRLLPGFRRPVRVLVLNSDF